MTRRPFVVIAEFKVKEGQMPAFLEETAHFARFRDGFPALVSERREPRFLLRHVP